MAKPKNEKAKKRRKKIFKKAVEILDAAKKIEKETAKDAKVEKAILRAFDKISSLVDDLGELLDIDDGRIEIFFDEVGEGMVKAQEGLDIRSAGYNVGRSKGALANMFRIPKVSAEIKFGLTKKSGKGFNILLASSRSESTETFQNSVSFDIISVPPPPDYLEEIPLDVALVTRIADRVFIENEMKKEAAKLAGKTTATATGQKEAKALGDMLKAFDKTLIFTHKNEKWLFFSYQDTLFDFIIYDRKAGDFEFFLGSEAATERRKQSLAAIDSLRQVAESQSEELSKLGSRK